MHVDLYDEVIEATAHAGNEDKRLKIEFVEIYDDGEGELAMARNCSNG